MKVVIALGSNLGEREIHIQNALEEMASLLTVVRVSSFIETKPVGGPPQGNYVNAVAICDSDLDPEELLERLMAIEANLGRVREVVNGPRTIDLDIISIEDLEIRSPNLTLPHPRAHLRDFVLRPWLEVEPEAHLVGCGFVKDLSIKLQP